MIPFAEFVQVLVALVVGYGFGWSVNAHLTQGKDK